MNKAGPFVKLYPLARAPVPPESVTLTSNAPAACFGVTAVNFAAETNVTDVAGTVPNITVAPLRKLLPAMVTALPPDVGPIFGVTLLTVGA